MSSTTRSISWITRRGAWALAGTLLAASGAIAGGQPFLPSIAVTSTVPANGDQNPYGVAIVPPGFPSGGPLSPGDVLVSNFNNSNNLQGTGTTIVNYHPNGNVEPPGQASVFFQGTGTGLTTALGVLQRGFVLVGNVPTTDGTINTIQPGGLLFLDRHGNQVAPSPYTNMLDGPWDLTIFDGFNFAKVFVSNVLNGTVTRLDLAVGPSSITVTSANVIASGYTVIPNSAALILGPTGLAYNPETDVLYVASTQDNAIYAVPHAGSRNASSGTGARIFQNEHLRGPLALGFAPNGDLLTANGDAVNADPNQPSEIVEFTPNGRFVSQSNVDASQGGAFGFAIGQGANGTLEFAAIDDVTGSLTVNSLPRSGGDSQSLASGQ